MARSDRRSILQIPPGHMWYKTELLHCVKVCLLLPWIQKNNNFPKTLTETMPNGN